jgi:hypothetical protein
MLAHGGAVDQHALAALPRLATFVRATYAVVVLGRMATAGDGSTPVRSSDAVSAV